jgi:hypothetical protein
MALLAFCAVHWWYHDVLQFGPYQSFFHSISNTLLFTSATADSCGLGRDCTVFVEVSIYAHAAALFVVHACIRWLVLCHKHMICLQR